MGSSLSDKYEFADGNGMLTIGKLGQMIDIEVVPRRK